MKEQFVEKNDELKFKETQAKDSEVTLKRVQNQLKVRQKEYVKIDQLETNLPIRNKELQERIEEI